MSLPAGTRIGPYEVVSLLGAGGMGEVYRARDAKLQREVALKILPAVFASDSERVARFEREAQVLASLNHPNIAAIYGFEEGRALVLELVEGPTLADRIAQGPIPIDEALPIARQIADALEAAHEHGVIHRDLKPANIKLRPDGTVKVLDFGLAKLHDSTPANVSNALSMSPTITSPALLTAGGIILGTAAYMSPEQARGKSVDRRTDIWAFGCLLYEMLTGRRAFEDEDVSLTLSKVLRVDPDVAALPPAVPPHVTQTIRLCLQKDPRTRAGDIHDVRLALDGAFETGAAAAVGTAVPRRASRTPLVVAAIAAALLIGAAMTWVAMRYLPAPADQVVARFEIAPPPGMIFPGANGVPRFAVSPDGQTLVFEAGPALTGPFHLWLRRLDRLDAEPLRLTAVTADNALQGMFWFPDGRAIGYLDEPAARLKRVDLQTGTVQNIADVLGSQLGGTANADGVVLFSSVATKGIFRVSATGGTPVQVTIPDAASGEQRHLWPRFLPDGRHFLYFVQADASTSVHVGSLDDPEVRAKVIDAPAMAEFAPPDRLLYMRDDTLLAQTMDMKTFALVGEPVIAAQPVFATVQGRPGFSVSNTGVLIHIGGTGAGTATGPQALMWVDRNGREQPVGSPVRNYTGARISPDGRRIVVAIADREQSLWVWHLQRQTLTRLTLDSARSGLPAWTPDSRRIVFSSAPRGPASLFAVGADGGSPERLTQAAADQLLSAVSPDGEELLFETNVGDGSGTDVYALTLKTAMARRLFSEPQPQRFATVSPDGRWLAYQSSESGGNEIFVRPYPGIGSRIQVSTNRGSRPRWSSDGRELFYSVGSGATATLMAVSVTPGPEWSATLPRALFRHPAVANGYDVSPDGQRFLLIAAAAGPGTQEPAAQESATPAAEGPRLSVIVNWTEELKRRAPAN